jgi:signal transduction histidine kinase
MSHELRTPLNSLLILARLLSENSEGNLTPKQVEFATTIHNAGSDLLTLINDILDLSKVEAGKMDINPADVPLSRVSEYVEQAFRPVAAQKGLTFDISIARNVAKTLHTDEQRLQQILKNLLSNAMKFTEQGQVTLRSRRPTRRPLPERGSEPDRRGARVRGDRHRHRRARGQAAGHLRGVPAGRRHDEPQVRRHRARPVDQPRDLTAAGR